MKIELNVASEFLQQLKEAVNSECFSGYDCSNAKFCCYLALVSGNSRILLNNAEFLQGTEILGNLIYFWGGNTAPASSDKVIEGMQKKLQDYSRDLELIRDDLQRVKKTFGYW